MEGTVAVNIFGNKSLNAVNYKFVKMLVLTVLALAMVVEGYRLDSSTPSPMGVNMIQNMCNENGANYTAVETAAVEFVNCMENDFGVKMFESELKEALEYNTSDALTRVFEKYCQKTPEMKGCYHKLLSVAAPCFGHEKEDFVKMSSNINDQILDYVCEYNGSIITKFIMEGGPQCLEEKIYEYMMCSETAKSSIQYINSTMSVTAIYHVYDNLLNCILHSVESCHSPVPARIVKGIGEIVKKIISEEENNVTTKVPTEPIWNESANTTERGLPADGSFNDLQVQFGNNGIKSNTDQDTKNVTTGSLKRLYKLSGNLNVAFNANLYI